MKPGPQHLTSACLLLSLFALGGCQEGATAPVPALEEEVVFREPLLVIPGTRWQERGAHGHWSFRNRASLVCWVREASGGPLVIRLRPNRNTAHHHFRFEWDGAELPASQIRRDEGGLRVALPAAQLTPGYHELTLKRDYRRDEKEHRQRLANVFREIRYRHGEHQKVLARDQLARYQLLAHFLQFKVVGETRERRGGVLFVGPGRHAIPLTPGSRGTLRFEPQNLSSRLAVFRAAGASVTVEGGARGVLAVELAAAAGELTLEVEGDPRGYFLWSMPLAASTAGRALAPIVLITLDTTRRDALGPYNGRTDLTPSLDRLASQATVFDQAYSTAPWTLPSHASIFTGLYPSKHGAGVSKKQLGDVPTLARLLRRRGYLAAGFSSGALSSSRFGLAQGFHLYRDPDEFETPGAHLAGYLDEFLDAYAHLPLFLFVNYFDPHALYQAPAAWQEKLGVPPLRERLRGQPVWEELVSGQMGGWRRLVEGEGEATPEGLAYLRASYLAEVAYTDHLLGRLFDRLRQLDLWDRALVVVTADHGELLGEGGYFSHAGRLDPELVEIPLLIKWPGQRQGRRSRRLVSLVDLFPTLLRAAGIEPPPSDGRPLEPGPDAGGAAHPYVLLEEHASMVHPIPGRLRIASHLFGVQRSAFRQLVWEEEQSCSRRDGDGWRAETCATEAASVLAAIRAQLGLAADVDYGDTAVAEELRESLEALGYM